MIDVGCFLFHTWPFKSQVLTPSLSPFVRPKNPQYLTTFNNPLESEKLNHGAEDSKTLNRHVLKYFDVLYDDYDT